MNEQEHLKTETADFSAGGQCSEKNEEKEREFIPDPNQKEKNRQTFFANWGSTIITAILCICIIAGGKMAHTVRVVGSSMYPTYENGNILVTKLNDTSTTDDIAYDDVIVCSLKDRGDAGKNNEKLFIKRVVGIPGDVLQVLNGRLYRNNELVTEDFPVIKDAGILKNKLKLGSDEYFVMGDNRNNSHDSRAFGPIKEYEITNIIRFKIF